MLAERRALVVSDDPDLVDRWTAWLDLEGYTTFSCPGPGVSWNCPREHGQRCVRREMVDVAVVDLGCDDDARTCTKAPDDRGTVFVANGVAAERNKVLDDVAWAANRAAEGPPNG